MKKVFFPILLLLAVTLVTLAMPGCKAWRTITTTATYSGSSDPSKGPTTITTKTVEEYTGRIKR